MFLSSISVYVVLFLSYFAEHHFATIRGIDIRESDDIHSGRPCGTFQKAVLLLLETRAVRYYAAQNIYRNTTHTRAMSKLTSIYFRSSWRRHNFPQDDGCSFFFFGCVVSAKAHLGGAQDIRIFDVLRRYATCL